MYTHLDASLFHSNASYARFGAQMDKLTVKVAVAAVTGCAAACTWQGLYAAEFWPISAPFALLLMIPR